MGKIKILFADTNCAYAQAIENKLVDEFAEFSEIHVITDVNFFRDFFCNPQSFDILIISQELYSEELYKHTFKETYILVDNIEDIDRTGSLNICRLYKYSSVKEIINQVMRGEVIKNNAGEVDNSTKVIAAYSPQGGAGTTTLAVSIAAIAAKSMRKVLYVAIDNLQNFTWFIENDSVFPVTLESKLSEISEYSYGEIKPAIIGREFDYLAPFRQAMSVLNISETNMVELVEEIKKTKEYDYIIVDTSADFNRATPKIMGIADKVIIVTEQDNVACKKIDRMLLNIDISDDSKFAVICNKYSEKKDSGFAGEKCMTSCHINYYIDYIQDQNCRTLEECIKNPQIQQAAYFFI